MLKEVEEMRKAGKGDEWIAELRKHAGVLFNIDWYRVVLDEAHAINNRTSQSKRTRLVLSPQSSIDLSHSTNSLQISLQPIPLGPCWNSDDQQSKW